MTSFSSTFKPETIRQAWFSNVPADLLAGTVVALALIPEAIAFSIIAGVAPTVGLYASLTMAVTIAFLGGRPGMVSAATGAMALLMVELVKNYGLEYLFAATLLTGVLQVLWGYLKVGRQMKYVPRAVLVGFVNALAILIFMAQLPELALGETFSLLAAFRYLGSMEGLGVYGMVALGLAIIYLLPRFTKLVPSPLVAIVVITAIGMNTALGLPTVGDKGDLPTSLPSLHLPEVPFTFDTLSIILPVALTMSAVGLLESFLTASVIDDMTDTHSDKDQEAKGQGIANLVTGFFGGMAGCAMIGQSVINIRSGGRQRLSTLSAGVFLFVFILVARPWVEQIPMAALVAVMIMVSISTFNWGSITNLRRMPKSETAVMLVTVLVTIITHNLAIGVIVGIAMSSLFFSRKIAKLVRIASSSSEDGRDRTYHVRGELFFVSVNDFLAAFDFGEQGDRVILDLTHSHIWDQSAVMAIDKVVLKFRDKGTPVELVGLNESSLTLLKQLAIHDKPGAKLGAH
ncbi:MAG: SulP family inorganic anion transporter [Cyanobacteria bacterium P01_A01_bin.105]